MVENPPAFPGGNKSSIDGRVANGMTLRDWFAGQALGALITQGKWTTDALAEQAYIAADAMLAERSK